MSFYEREQKAISQDQADNRIIQTLLTNYQQLKQNYEQLQQQNTDFVQQIERLKQLNHSLQEEITQLKSTKKNEEVSQTKTSGFLTKLMFPQQSLTPNMLNKTIQGTFSSQQTKRRVINGFVDELTQQLEQSEHLLKKERIMQEETRRSLQICSQELASTRIVLKELESQVSALSRENQQLLQELQLILRQKSQLQARLSATSMQYKKLKGSFLINVEQFQCEMSRMDGIYTSIEMELGATR